MSKSIRSTARKQRNSNHFLAREKWHTFVAVRLGTSRELGEEAERGHDGGGSLGGETAATSH